MKAAAAVCSAAAVICTAASVSAGTGVQDWPQSRHDARNGAATELAAPKSGAPRARSFDGSGRTWRFEPGMTAWTSAALGVVDDRAVVAVGSYDHMIYVLDAANGELLWKQATGGPFYGAPILWGDGDHVVLFAASGDRLLYALDAASGRQLWVHSVEQYRPTLGGARLAAPCIGRAQGHDAVFVAH